MMNRIFTPIFVGLLLLACSRPYQVGDHVLVEWGSDELLYPAFITEKRGKSWLRVHFEGYPSRWDETVQLPRIKGLVVGEVTPPPPPLKVRVAQGLKGRKNGLNAPVSQFKEGQSIRVRWRDSIYRAVVLEVISTGELRVHYEGHVSAWDEVVSVSRVVDK